jgi:two-component system OmpR family sensor kinase
VRRWKLRTRVVLAAALAMLVGVVGLEIVVQAILGRELHQQLDHTLQQRAADVDEIAESHPKQLKPGDLAGDPRAIGTDVEVIDSRGTTIVSSRPGEKLLPSSVHVLDSRGPRFATVHVGGQQLRVFIHPLEKGAGPGNGGAVIVAASTDAIEDGLASARWLTLAAGIAAAAVAALACLVMTTRALRPLTQLNADVMEVQRTADPTRRIASEPTGDELDQLATALNAMLEALQRAREVERRFVADASHEMRTPLTALRGNAAYLSRHGADADTDAFRDLENDMARLAQLLERLLALAREDAAGQPSQPVAVHDILDRFSTDPRVEVSVEDGLMVRADADAIERALTNLIENAKLYGPADTPIVLSGVREADDVVLTVADAGDGIPDATLDLATTRFWRGANSVGHDGAGLGLGLVRATAERHGGSFTIDGSRFSMRLPALTEVPPLGA